MDSFAQYIDQITQSLEEVDYVRFALNLLVTAGLASVLSWFYIRYGNAVSNRARFARNFLPLALTTMLIIFIVKSSVTLSLGLVGALSIVRFRSAIKDPEELVYLFLTIGLGLAAGANEIMVAAIAFVFILGLLFLQHISRGRRRFRSTDNMHLHLATTNQNLPAISEVLARHLQFVELRRMDQREDRMDLAFVVSAKEIGQIESVRKELTAMPGHLSLSLVEQRHLPV